MTSYWVARPTLKATAAWELIAATSAATTMKVRSSIENPLTKVDAASCRGHKRLEAASTLQSLPIPFTRSISDLPQPVENRAHLVSSPSLSDRNATLPEGPRQRENRRLFAKNTLPRNSIYRVPEKLRPVGVSSSNAMAVVWKGSGLWELTSACCRQILYSLTQ